MKHIIIGGVAGGATAAARIRRIDEQAEITMIEKRHHISYANCGLPYYLGNVITERTNLFVKTAADFKTRFNVEVKIQTEVLSINSEDKTVLIQNPDGSKENLPYDKLLLSPGAIPVIPPLKGINLPGIFTLRNVADTDNIKEYIEHEKVKRAVIVGAGFIGLEMAENFKNNGIDVTIVEMANQVMGPLDFSMAALVRENLLQNGVKLMLNEQVQSFEANQQNGQSEIKTNLLSGIDIYADMVILSIGVRPQTELAEKANIKLGVTKGIRVDKYLQTSIKDIYAVGDAIEYPHPITKEPWLNYLAGPANRQARVAATNMVRGNTDTYEGSIGTSIAKIFDQQVAVTGLVGKKLKQLNTKYKATATCSSSNADYYPGALKIAIKLTFSVPDGKLLGAQVVGQKGVDKRIDQLALLIKKGGTVQDLMEIEHAYAPPFSSAKDPIAIAGYVATNVLTGEMSILNWREMYASLHNNGNVKNLRILDVRTKEEVDEDPVPGTENIPLDELRDRLNELDTNQAILVYCLVGLRGYLAFRILQKNGFKEVYNLTGGMKIYKSAVAALEN